MGADIVKYGIATGDVYQQRRADRSTLGTVNVARDFRIVEQTDQVPLRRGISFGITYEVNGKPNGLFVPIQVRVITPGLRNAATGRTSHVEEWQSWRELGGIGSDAFTFGEDWELVPGQWTFELYYKDKKLTEKAFTIDRSDE